MARVGRRGAALFGLLGVGATVSSLIACQSILGIETDREPYQTYPEGGYKGCTESPDCGQCVNEEHRCLCETGTSCSADSVEGPDEGGGGADAEEDSNAGTDSSAGGSEGRDDLAKSCSPDDDCEGCEHEQERCLCAGGSEASCSLASCSDFADGDECRDCACRECHASLSTCFEDPDCLAVFTCAEEHRCDPLGIDGADCYAPEFCQEVIDEASLKSLNRLAKLTACALDARCPCGGEDLCTVEAGCDCGDCWQRCECEEKNEATCLEECGGTECTPGNCQLCVDCRAECLCQGNTPAACDLLCSAWPEGCDGLDCTGCPDCWAQCYCEGESDAVCQERCEDDLPPSISCDTQTCYPEDWEGTPLRACCPPQLAGCGLDLTPMTGSDVCVPLAQPGTVDETCNLLDGVGSRVLEDRILEGCCRPDGTCGFVDPFSLSLGCVKRELVGDFASKTCTPSTPPPVMEPCTESEVVDLGEENSSTVLLANGCARISQVPSVSFNRILLEGMRGSFPLSYNWEQPCEMTGGEGQLTSADLAEPIGPATRGCDILLRLHGDANDVTLRWYPAAE